MSVLGFIIICVVVCAVFGNRTTIVHSEEDDDRDYTPTYFDKDY